jgi:hypothetical protein
MRGSDETVELLRSKIVQLCVGSKIGRSERRLKAEI